MVKDNLVWSGALDFYFDKPGNTFSNEGGVFEKYPKKFNSRQP